MIDTDKYDNEGIELSDGGTICFPESDGRMERIDKDGNTMEVRYLSNNKGQEWYELFDTHKNLLAEVKRLRKLEAAVVGSWMKACDHRGPWHKALRGPCVELGYFELRDVEHTRKSFDGKAFTYTSKEFCLKEEYLEMAKEWMVEIYGEDWDEER